MEHQNIEIINKFFQAYGNKDIDGVKQVLDEKARWIFPGQNSLSGTKSGLEEIVEFFDRMGKVMSNSNIKVEKLITGINNDYIVECHIYGQIVKTV